MCACEAAGPLPLTIHLSTLVASSAVLAGVCAALLLLFWLRAGRPSPLLWSSLPFVTALAGAALLAVPAEQPDAPALLPQAGIGLVLVTYGLTWQAVRAQHTRRVLAPVLLGPPLLWLLLDATAFVPLHMPVMSVAVRASVMGLFQSFAAYELWRSREDGLPSRPVLVWVFAIYAALAFARVPLSGLLPEPLGAAPGQPWAAALLIFALAAQALLVGGLMIAMTHERVAKRNFELAHYDPLTGGLNRRAYHRHFERLESERNASLLALVLFDIDQFKTINDRFGHAVGDEIIVLAARAAQQALRRADRLFRIGGDEFACLLTATTDPGAVECAARLRRTFETIATGRDGKAVAATISLGVAVTRGDPLDQDALYAAADRALYEAKNTGRNRTEIAPSYPAPLRLQSGFTLPDDG